MLTKKLTEHYYNKGYVTTLVNIPAQKVKNQTLRLEVLEGKVGNIQITEGRFFESGN